MTSTPDAGTISDLRADLRAQLGSPADFWYWTQNREARLDEMEREGLRWCACCGRDLSAAQGIDALYCCQTCRKQAWRIRRRAGIRASVFHKPEPAVGDKGTRRLADWPARLRQLRERHALAFTLCHPGMHPDRAPEVCPRWGWPAFDDGEGWRNER